MPLIRRTAIVAPVTAAMLFGGFLASTPACGTDPVGVESCQKIEKVRCESAQACGIDLDRPVHSGNSAEDNVRSCTRYYEEQCQHGLAIAKDPGTQAVNACVDAIINGDCSVVKAPESSPSCAFLDPARYADASADAADATGQ